MQGDSLRWDRGATYGPKFVSESVASDVGRRSLCLYCDVGVVGKIARKRHETGLQESTKNAVGKRA